MNGRERFVQIAKGDLKNHVFLPMNLNVSWFMDETIETWRNQGLPADADLLRHFEFDRIDFFGTGPYDFVPAFDVIAISEDEHTRTIRNERGAVVRILKEHGPSKMPQWLEYPVKNRRDWDEIKKRLDPDTAARYPADWQVTAAQYANRDYPLGLAVGSFYGHTLQAWVGSEQLCMLFYDDPALVHEMLDYLEEFFLKMISRCLEHIKFDYASFGEDIAYKGRSFLSPQMFKDFIQKHYIKIVDLLHAHNIDIIFVDSDGFIDEIIPLWMQVGINGFSPLEVAAGEDALLLKKQYGSDIILVGNVDKRALIAGPSEIDKELEKVRKLLSMGGYFPAVDHSVPPDVPLVNFMYYLDKLKRM